MTEEVREEYEVSSEGAVRHWPVSYARMFDITPTPTQPAALTSLVFGKEVCGTVLSIDADVDRAIVDFTSSMVYLHSVRDVRTYAGNVENTWGAINEGDVIYYDRDANATMPVGTKLSTSPLDSGGVVNPVFGWAIYSGRVTYPLGSVAAATVDVAVMQSGSGGGA